MATEQEIKDAFQKLAAEFHATGKPANADEVEAIRKIVTAYRVSRAGGPGEKAGKRQEYDRYGQSLPSQELMADLDEQDQAPKSPMGFWVGLDGSARRGFLRLPPLHLTQLSFCKMLKRLF
jgi:DnaJ-class molecular chaperone